MNNQIDQKISNDIETYFFAQDCMNDKDLFWCSRKDTPKDYKKFYVAEQCDKKILPLTFILIGIIISEIINNYLVFILPEETTVVSSYGISLISERENNEIENDLSQNEEKDNNEIDHKISENKIKEKDEIDNDYSQNKEKENCEIDKGIDNEKIINSEENSVEEKSEDDNKYICLVKNSKDLDNIISLHFESSDSSIDCTIDCEKNLSFSEIEETLVKKFNSLQGKKVLYLANGEQINKNLSIDGNKLKKNNTIVIANISE